VCVVSGILAPSLIVLRPIDRNGHLRDEIALSAIPLRDHPRLFQCIEP
jgi:hypothetical protein